MNVGDKFISIEGYEYEVLEISGGWCIIRYKEYLMNRVPRKKILNGKASLFLYQGGYVECSDLDEYHKMIESYAYACWKSILRRVGKGRYENVGIHREWLNYRNFKKFYDKWYHEGFAIDKDLLSEGDKIYSKETCCFIPKALNSAIRECNNREIMDCKEKKRLTFSVTFGWDSMAITCKDEKEYKKLFALYRCVKVRTLLSLYQKQIRPEAVDKIIKLYNYTNYGKNTDSSTL